MNNLNNLLMFIEISKNSRLKFEYDYENKLLKLDRILLMDYPFNYGCFLEKNIEDKTLNEDGDSLDVICIGETMPNNCLISVRVIGVIELIDDGEKDDKILVINNSETNLDCIQDIKDINQSILDKIKDFFTKYKEHQNKIVQIQSFGDKKRAEEIINKCKNLYKKKILKI